ncbi:MAG: GNAT family N-acetyltransferase [Candidatus Nealsonbacteria bacterium]|nr:GNAT family N-acetyltransferase [Candidatus Nealsonbacteria bacterium]
MMIRKSKEKDFKGMMRVAKSLHPKWFNEFAIRKSIPLDLKIHKGFIAEEKGKIIGFLTYTSREGTAELSWIGVDPKFHHKNIGKKLVESLEAELKKFGVEKLYVDTLSETEEYEPYEATRIFYKKVGFKFENVRKVKDKGTGEEFDMATYIKKIH